MKIAFGHLKHHTVNKDNPFMPVGIGYIASYVSAFLGKDKVDVRLFTDPQEMLDDIEAWKPDVVALANYCWTEELSCLVFRHAKKTNQDVLCVMGGPNFPSEPHESKDFLKARNEIDFYVHLEGEIAFAHLMDSFRTCEMKIKPLKNKIHDGVMHIDPTTEELVTGKTLPRIMDMDVIPSPYLNGFMDKWFDGKNFPSLETSRGCPYACTFCYVGLDDYNKIGVFSLDRIEKEIIFMSQKMQPFDASMLSICDSNFGMFKRDEDVAKIISSCQDKYGWPQAFDCSTGKSQHERIVRVAEQLKGKLQISGSLQSTNPETLRAIKRKNLPQDKHFELLKQVDDQGMRSRVELIFPLPNETKGTFLDGAKNLLKVNLGLFVPYTTMLLKGTELASKESRAKYKLYSKYRVLPQQYGEYSGEKCFEIEEVCVATNTVTYEEYLDVRGFAFLVGLFNGEQYDIILRHILEFDIEPMEFFLILWDEIKNTDTLLSKIYFAYIKETDDELFDSSQEVTDFFMQEENYIKLKRGILGDNLIKKYTAKVYMECHEESFETAYRGLIKILGNSANENLDSLLAAKQWAIETRNIAKIFTEKNLNSLPKTRLNLTHDVKTWYSQKSKSLKEFNTLNSILISPDIDRVQPILDEVERMYAGDIRFRIGKMITNFSMDNFWYKSVPCLNDRELAKTPQE